MVNSNRVTPEIMVDQKSRKHQKEGKIDFYESQDALRGKAEFENGQVETIGNIDDFDEWLDNL
ncbi:hypothetical protein ACLUWF_05840 [Limosilactobacillus mucosae]|uniref:hypothetical protein n=1 Tax=Limosilactobacillus mucosae TaxID=97478 RepID=UPI0039930988